MAVTWAPLALPTGWAFAGVGIEHNGKILVGGTSDASAPVLLTSVDGGTTFTSQPWTVSATAPRRFAASATRIVAGTGADLVYSDDDGATWTLGATADSTRGLVCNGTGFMAMASTTVMHYSLDGAAWTTRTGSAQLPMTNPNAIAGANGVMYMAGYHSTTNISRVSRSLNGGATWTNVLTGSRGSGFYAIRASGTQCIAVGALGMIHVSENSGLDWLDKGNAGATSNARSVAGQDQAVVIMNEGSSFWSSTDAMATVVPAILTGVSFPSGTAVNVTAGPPGVWLAFSRNNTFSSPNSPGTTPAVSEDNGSTWTAIPVSASVWGFVRTSTGVLVITSTAEYLQLFVPPAELRASTDWPIQIDAAPVQRVSTDWPIAVAAAQLAVTPWPVQVLDAATVGGLNGAGTWAAAPGGQWEAVVWLGADNISARLLGAVSVQIAADSARVAEFSFLPATALQPMSLVGQRVRIAFAQAGGLNAQTLFAGVVDVPTIDLQTGAITCACHDQAQEVWANTARAQIDALVGGRWHVAVSGEPEDSFAYLQERIQSVGASWALDTNQAPRLLPWRNTARAVTVRTADVIDGSLAVDLPSREQLRTRITCRMQYRYPVHRARGIVAQWSQPLAFFMPNDQVNPKPTYTFMTVAMVQGAAGSPSGWDLQREITIENPPAGSWPVGAGFFVISARVAPDLALGFTGLYRTRWQQSVTEDYTVDVVWPAAEAQLGGPVSEEIGATLESRFDTPGWDSDPSVEPAIAVSGVGDFSQPYQADGATAQDRDEAMRTLLDRAWVRLWSASRSGRVRFALPCRPDLWLDTWATVEHERVRAAGQIVEIEHVLDLDAGTAVTSCAVAVGLPGNTAATLPAWTLPASPYTNALPVPGQLSATIGTFVGGLADSPPYDADTMVGFTTNVEGGTDPALEYYPHQLSIGWPELTADDRDPRELAATAQVDVAVPTDLLEILPL